MLHYEVLLSQLPLNIGWVYHSSAQSGQKKSPMVVPKTVRSVNKYVFLATPHSHTTTPARISCPQVLSTALDFVCYGSSAAMGFDEWSNGTTMRMMSAADISTTDRVTLEITSAKLNVRTIRTHNNNSRCNIIAQG